MKIQTIKNIYLVKNLQVKRDEQGISSKAKPEDQFVDIDEMQ